MPETYRTYCFLVRGTSFFRATLPQWVGQASKMRDAISAALPGCVIEAFPWNGAFNQTARHEAAIELARRLNEIRDHFDRIILIGHSHGGNVSIEAAYRAPLASAEIVTLNTPFLTASSTDESDSERRLRLLLFSVSLVAAISVALLFGGSERIVAAIGLVLATILVWAFLGRKVVSRWMKVNAFRRSVVLQKFTNAPIRRGSRCLVVSHRGDEMMSSFHEIKGWASRYFFSGGLREASRSKSHVLPPDVWRLLVRIVVLYVFGQVTYVFARTLPPPWLLIPELMTGLALIIALYYGLVLVAIIFSVFLFLVAIFIVIILWPIASLGLSLDSLFVVGRIKAKPRAEPGANIQYFEFVDAGHSPLRSALDRVAPIRLPLYKGTVRARIGDVFRVGLGIIFGLLNATRLIARTAIASRHRRVYNDPAVLARIDAWLS